MEKLSKDIVQYTQRYDVSEWMIFWYQLSRPG